MASENSWSKTGAALILSFIAMSVSMYHLGYQRGRSQALDACIKVIEEENARLQAKIAAQNSQRKAELGDSYNRHRIFMDAWRKLDPDAAKFYFDTANPETKDEPGEDSKPETERDRAAEPDLRDSQSKSDPGFRI